MSALPAYAAAPMAKPATNGVVCAVCSRIERSEPKDAELLELLQASAAKQIKSANWKLTIHNLSQELTACVSSNEATVKLIRVAPRIVCLWILRGCCDMHTKDEISLMLKPRCSPEQWKLRLTHQTHVARWCRMRIP